MNTRIILKSLACAALTLTGVMFNACTDIEEHPDGRVTFDEIFSSDRKTGGYLNTCYSHLQRHGMWYGSNAFLDEFTDNAYDANSIGNSESSQWWRGQLTPYANPIETGSNGNWWGNYFEGIRQCNVFIANIDNAKTFTSVTRQRYKAQVYTLRAYYLLQLIKRYGGVPFSSEDYGLDFDYSSVTSSSFAHCVRQIISDCDAALAYNDDLFGWHSGTDDLERCKMSKGIAWAVKSEAVLFAASPLWYDDADPEKVTWTEAARVAKEALDALKANGYELYSRTPTTRLAQNPYDLYFLSRSDVAGTVDKETILEIRDRLEVYRYHGLPTIDGAETSGANPTQELVDCYELTNGVRPILGYADSDHLQPVINPAARTGSVKYDDQKPYDNRDPRMTATIYYNYSLIRGDQSARVGTYVGLDGTPDGEHIINVHDRRYTNTGYYLRKYTNGSSNHMENTDGYFKLLRFAEILLNYAEAANEAAAATVPDDAVDAANEVRKRAGMPDIPYGLSKEEFRDRIHNERRVEFAFEEQRFFDVRRWKVLNGTGKRVSGVDNAGNPIEGFEATGNVVTGMSSTGVKRGLRTTYTYTRFVVTNQRNAVDDKYLIFPIPGDEVVRMINYNGVNIQNPGW